MATIINQRWPRDITPAACRFGRSRNAMLQESPRTRVTSVIQQGRPLWSADCTWSLPNSDGLAKLRYWLDGLDGFNGSVQMWDFACPYPFGLTMSLSGFGFWTFNNSVSSWTYTSFPSHWTPGNSVPLSASYAIGVTTVAVTGCDPSKLVCVQGQYIQIGRRIYLAAANATADGAGAATITLQTGLMAAATAGDSLYLVEAACEMRMADQNYDESAQAGQGMIQVTAKFIETAQDFS